MLSRAAVVLYDTPCQETKKEWRSFYAAPSLEQTTPGDLLGPRSSLESKLQHRQFGILFKIAQFKINGFRSRPNSTRVKIQRSLESE
jgi:hypothetical protein